MALPRTVKLLNCLRCEDIFRLQRVGRFCKCRQCYGKMLTPMAAEVVGPARVLGLRATDYVEAPRGVDLQNLSKLKPYTWYVISPQSDEVYHSLDVIGDMEDE